MIVRKNRYQMATITAGKLKEAADLLGISDRASLNDIRSRYHERIKEWHPDVSGKDASVSHEMTIRVKEAYDLLVDYCMNHAFSFRLADLAKDLERNPADYWTERFGEDPIWG
jgi:preprotein translocase subunit Sec63